MGGCLGFCDDRGQRARAAVWGAGLTQALGRRGPWLRSLGPQSRTGGRGRAPGSLPEQDGTQRPGPGEPPRAGREAEAGPRGASQSRTGGRGGAPGSVPEQDGRPRLGPGSLPEQDGRQRPGPGSLRLRLCENEHHSCRPGRAASGLLCEEGSGGRLGLEPGLRGGLPMQVDGAGWGVWESFKESSRPLRQQC